MDCAAYGVPAPRVVWRAEPPGGAGFVLRPGGGDQHQHHEAALPLVEVLPHNNSLRFRPFHAREFDPSVHSAGFRCEARSQSGAVLARRVRVKAGRWKLSVSL